MQLRLPLFAFSLAFAATPVLASPNGVVISGFQTRGPNGASDEYVEIHNTSGGAVNISGWKLQGCAASGGALSVKATVGAVTLAAGQYYLFTNSSTGGYSGSIASDKTYTIGISDFIAGSSPNMSGLELTDGSNALQDGIGSPASPCREGAGLATPTRGAPVAYQRLQDTSHNESDFTTAPWFYPYHNFAGAVSTQPVAPACASPTRIYTIQGSAHISPLNTQAVCGVPGIVTQVVSGSSGGYYMQDADGDNNPNTSDGIFVFTGSAPPVGTEVVVKGTVSEFRPGGASSTGLTITEIGGATLTALPATSAFTSHTIAPTIIGAGGRVPPNQIIDSLSASNVESASHIYDPSTNAIDFYESLEGMLVQVSSGARVVGPTNKFGEIWLAADGGAGAAAGAVNAHGGVTIAADGSNFNPERVQIDTSLLNTPYPQQNVGDTTTADIAGAMSYDFGNYRIFPNTPPQFASGNLQPASSMVANDANHLRVISYNLENLNSVNTCPSDDSTARIPVEAAQIVNNLGAPDILGIEEIQDNNGCTDDGTVDATTTLNSVVNAIVTAGGPTYSYLVINPVNDQDGGIPGGNIRQAILYNPVRLTLVPGTVGTGDSTTATAVSKDAYGRLQLTLSPGRIDPTNAVWTTSRKPLAATFDFNGRRVLVILNHFDSKGGDDPLFGFDQPPLLRSAVQRVQQAQVEHDFINQALTINPAARVISLGDFNDYDFSAPMQTLSGTGAILTDLATALLPGQERYSYVYQGNSEELDHIYVTSALLNGAQFQPVHVNSEFSNQVSDHDPMIASLPITPNQPPTADAGAHQSVNEAAAVTLDGSASSDADGKVVVYTWAQTGGNATVTLDTTNPAKPTFTAPNLADTLTFQLMVSDNDGATSTVATTQVTVNNVSPTANAGADQRANKGATVTLNGSASSDAAPGSITSYSWTQTQGPAVTLAGANTATATFTAPSEPGQLLVFRLVVTDNEGATAAATTQVTINQPPIANAGGNQNVNEGAPVALNGSGSGDADGTISYAWTQTSGTAVTLQNANTATPTFTAPHRAGTLMFVLTVTDNDGATASASAVVNVVNQLPVANAGGNQTVRYGATVELNGTASYDADGPITYAWTQTSGTSVTLQSANTATPTFTAPSVAGTLGFSLTVTDSDGAISTASTLVTIADIGPSANAGGNQNVNEGAGVALNGTASSDVDGPITYAWTQTAGTMVNLQNANTATPTFTAPHQAGVLVFTLIVTDSDGATATATTQVTIVNQLPLANAGGNQMVSALAQVALNGTASSDADGPITYAWTQTGGPAVTLQNASTATPTFTAPNQPATLTFALTVTDGDGATATALTQVTVVVSDVVFRDGFE